MTDYGVLFDLDGTLADTLVDLCVSLNHALALGGFPPHTDQGCRARIGGGARELVRRALPPEAEAQTDQVLEAFRVHYQAHLLDRTVLYPGIAALLDRISAQGLPLGLWSNKPQEMTEAIAARLLAPWSWRIVRGHRRGVPPKPSTEALPDLLGALGLPAGRVAMVGDSEVDLGAARAGGMAPFTVLWGLRDEETLRAAGASRLSRSPAELADQLLDWSGHAPR
ncbi:MAG: HAD family hydrolase [Deltaproteobacteria bacterium]|nr:HAD family hydrolase [Deltaproteobacteria bacterium]